jgi:hypothetical protein
MSLERFSNKQSILDNNGLQRGIVWSNDILPSLMLDERVIVPSDFTSVEVHVYTKTGEYITGDKITDYKLFNSRILIDYAKVLNGFNIPRGTFEVATSIYANLIGSIEEPAIQVKEISPDRRELLLQLAPMSEEKSEEYNDAFSRYLSEYISAFSSDIALNFGKNKVYKIINQKEWITDNSLVVRLYNPLPDDIIVNDTLYIIEELADTYIDNVHLSSTAITDTTNNLRGPNFDIDTNYTTITETEFKNWNELLGTNLSTSQQIINSYFSGSLDGLNIGVDYTAFNNFVFYGSATERLSNFRYKLQLLEYFDSQLNTLNSATGNNTTFANNIDLYNNRKQELLGTFDNFERWLYYEPTSSLTTHGISGGYIGSQEYVLTPWPKYLSGSLYYVHPTTSTVSQNWYNGFISTASFYDQENATALIKTIPQHLRDDENNSEYELFVNMIGQHFDILYTYINALSKTYYPEEQPKLGIGNEGLYEVASSMGWKLANGRQASSLWQYKLGYNDSGSYTTTGSLFSKTDEQITTEIWRRTVNNLPYLLKTKGTARSIKALMNVYGIPQTLLSIREYGGPHPDADTPALIEDRFAYALHLTGSNNGRVIVPAPMYPTASIGNWQIPLTNGTSTSGYISPITREIRFQPTEKQTMMLLSLNNTTASNSTHGSIIAIEYTASYSGSSEYGRLWHTYSSGSGGVRAISSSTEWLPLYDGDMWNLRWWWNGGGTHYNTQLTTGSSTTYYIQVQKASDYINGKIIHQASSSVTPIRQSATTVWAAELDGRSTNFIHIGGASGSSNVIYTNLQTNLNSVLKRFSGEVQEYREWVERLDQNTFDIHTLNPTSYVSSLNPTASYYTLVRHYTLGSDVQAYDHSTEQLFITSSHPANHIKNFTTSVPYVLDTSGITDASSTTYASASAFIESTNIQRGQYVPIEETYYIDGVSLGGQLPRSEKIRLEDNYLIRRLSPTNTAEVSSFDYAPIDTNRLGLFYSQADQANKDIFDNIGDVALDDYVGDPNDEFDYYYPNLNSFSNQYWKKYTNRNDINAYIRVFSQFDFTLFNQIKQLLPARVDAAMGLLVEPHALERNKIALTKRIQVENPQYNVTFTALQPTASSEVFPDYSASIFTSYTISADSTYHSGSSNGYVDTGNTYANIVLRDHVVATEYLVEEVPVDQLGNAVTPNIYTNFSKTNAGLASQNNVTGNQWKLQLPYNSIYTNTTSASIAPGGITSQLITVYNNTLQSDITYNTVNITVSTDEIIGASISLLTTVCTLCLVDSNNIISYISSYQNNTSTVSWPLTLQFSFNDVYIPAYTNYGVILEFKTDTVSDPVQLCITNLSTQLQLEKVYTSAIRPEIVVEHTTNEWSKKVYHYSGSINSTKILKNAYHATSQSLGLYYSSSLQPFGYTEAYISQFNNPRFDGCKLTGPDINVNSNIAAIGNTPVIEVYETNANQLIFTNTPVNRSSGNNREPGNLTVR